MKRLLAIALVFILALSMLTACGGNAGGNNGNGGGNGNPTSTSGETNNGPTDNPNDGDNNGEVNDSSEWPDNEFTRRVPNPGYEVYSALKEGNNFTIIFLEVSAAQTRAYAQQVKAAGFNINIDEDDEEDSPSYYYDAYDANGNRVEIGRAMGRMVLEITMP